MSSFEMLPLEALANAGRFLGGVSKSLDLLTTGEELKAAKRFHQWDGKNTLEIRPFLKYIDDHRRRSMVESILESFKSELIDTKVAQQFPKALIHGDFNDANVLLNEQFCVSGVIDFGDSVER